MVVGGPGYAEGLAVGGWDASEQVHRAGVGGPDSRRARGDLHRECGHRSGHGPGRVSGAGDGRLRGLRVIAGDAVRVVTQPGAASLQSWVR
jgi:hypothetical protein